MHRLNPVTMPQSCPAAPVPPRSHRPHHRKLPHSRQHVTLHHLTYPAIAACIYCQSKPNVRVITRTQTAARVVLAAARGGRTSCRASACTSLIHRGVSIVVCFLVLAWLGKLRLSQYGDRLVEEGFDTIDRLACVEQGDLEEIGMRKGHIRQLMRAVELTTQSGTGFGATSSVALTASTPPSAGSVPVSSHSASTPDKRQSSAPLAAVRAQSAPVAPSEPAPSDSAAAVAALRHAAQFVLSSDEIRFKGCVGRGSFGLVHRGTWRGMEVAVKELDQSVVFANAPDPEPVPPPTRPALQPGDRQLAHDTYATSIAPASPPKVISKDQQPARWQTLSAVIPSVARAPGAGAERAETGAGNGSMEGIGGEDEDAVGARLTRGTYLRLVNELKHEAAVMARVCNHDHVVQFVGVITSPVPAIVTRFMSGGSLDHLMLKSHRHNRREHMTLLQTFRMLRDAAAGVLHLHHEGVIHRDLAARNLLLDGYGSVRVIYWDYSPIVCAHFGLIRTHTRACARRFGLQTSGSAA